MNKLNKRQIVRAERFLREKAERAKAESAKFHHRSPEGDGRKKRPVFSLVAENADLVIIVASFVSPPLKTGLVDRFLVMAGRDRVDSAVVLNKSDLLGDLKEGEKVVALYRSLGYTVFMTSVHDGRGMDMFEELVRGRTSLLAGHSGVGKSSLLNCLRSGTDRRVDVQEVSEATGKGKHTTTTVKLHRIDDRTKVFDLPGMKLAALFDIAPTEIQTHFPEFAAPSRRCRFADCLHAVERECGVKNGVEEGLVSRQRYASYLRMIRNP